VRVRLSVLALLAAVVMTVTTGLAGAPAASATTTREGRLLTRITEARAAHGLRALRLSSDLSGYARGHSREMSVRRTLFHTSNFGVLCCWSAIAENVGVAYSVGGVHRAFMGSTPHQANILDRRMRAVGIGVVESGGRLWVTEIFRRPS
jgi:uncharacterized protein YkwD